MSNETPMKRQYNEIKKKHQDCLLFFRLGDFYEMFDEDAVKASAELDLTLTSRDKSSKSPENRTPMCGVPYHSAESYIARLVQKGYKVAICEQTEDPAKAKGIVTREVVRVITPGTVIETSMLPEGQANYLAAVYLDQTAGAICLCELSTGEFCVAAFEENPESHILNELSRFSPAEVVLSLGASESEILSDFFRLRLSCHTELYTDQFEFMAASMRVCHQFESSSLDALGIGDMPAAACAAGALLAYLSATQKRDLSHIRSLDILNPGLYMELDYATRHSLELTENMRTGEKKGSLLWVLDQTKTSMGVRLLRTWVERPELSLIVIRRRQAAITALSHNNVIRGELREVLRKINDIPRLTGKISYGNGNGRDLLALGHSLSQCPNLVSLLSSFSDPLLSDIRALDPLADITGQILRAICDEPPFSVREGNIIRTGYSEELDKLRSLRDNGARMMAELETRERTRTGIKKLKVGYNKVFGYFIDIPRSASGEIPDDYIRKQTLVSNERYFTAELKQLEDQLLHAKDRLADLEYRMFQEICGQVTAQVSRIQATADRIAQLDVLCSLAEVAVKNQYVCPEVNLSSVLRITGGRHPVVELAQTDTLFVPNDTLLNDKEDRVAIITGPNMAGKSTYMRQTALIVLMAQMGSFVPAVSAEIGIVDRVFTRIGASDDLASGQSTFMVEMSETAAILKHATAKSLLILDEIGRGTSTYDGMAIARAVLEYCADPRRLGAKTMFATHYHELAVLEAEIPGVRNYHITAKKQGDSLIFLRKIIAGAADDSYGIEVAKLAGIHESVIACAKRHLKLLESLHQSMHAAEMPCLDEAEEEDQISFAHLSEHTIIDTLRSTSIETLTPIEALNLLYDLKKKAEAQ